MQTITIRNEYRAEAKKHLEKLAKRARRAGNTDVTFSIGPAYGVEKTRRRLDGKLVKYVVEYADVQVEGEAPKVEGWTFVARVEFEDGLTLIQHVPGTGDLPREYRETDRRCEHCHVDRNRKDVFVLRHDDGRYQQVGRTCLKDFLGFDSPAAVIAKFEFLREIDAMGDDEPSWAGGTTRRFLNLDDLLAQTNLVVRHKGWCSKGRAMQEELKATAHTLADYLWGKDKEDRELRAELGQPEAQDYEVADATIAWVRSWKGDDLSSDYRWNLSQLFELDSVDAKHMGLVCSAVASYLREQERLQEQERKAKETAGSEHVGEIGERLRQVSAQVVDRRVMPDRGYGESILYKFADDDGNVLTWFCSSCEDLGHGWLLLDGTVKAHNEFKGTKETQLTRCKVRAQ